MSIKHRTGGVLAALKLMGIAALALSFIMVMVPACKSAPWAGAAAPAAPAGELDAAVRETSDYLNKQLPKGNKLVILNIQSDFPALSEYIIDELIA
ncbi:MAG: hypothetical protein LBD08_05650, partial [Treponema sp.]|nr:hypothetical protein [Treponema sp.]